jgi:hypothetical protein
MKHLVAEGYGRSIVEILVILSFVKFATGHESGNQY